MTPPVPHRSSSSGLRCVVVEDQRMFLELLVRMLRSVDGLAVVATAGTAAEGIAICQEHRPDLLILDLGLADANGEVVAEALAEVNPNARLIVLSAQASSFACPARLQPMLQAVVDKIEAFDSLSDEIAELLQDRPGLQAKLTARERELLRLLGQGLSNLQMSEVMGLSVHTVETHRRNLSSKLGLKGAVLVRHATLKMLSGD